MKSELLIIGGGPGGYAAAFLAADKGMNVILIDKEKNPGGVCLYRGCIPSKALLHIAKLINETREAKKWGLYFGEPKIDLKKLRAFKNKVVAKLTGGTGMLARQRNINYIQGKAKFLTSNTVGVEEIDGSYTEITFEKAIIAIGSAPATIPGVEIDGDVVITSKEALELKDIPERMLVVGGGYIGLELGSVYSALGSKVTVTEMMPAILPGADQELVAILSRSINKKFQNIYLETKLSQITIKNGKAKVKFDGKFSGEDTFDKVLVAIGRKPVTEGIGLENTSVTLNSRGFIEVNQQMQTNDTNIFAIGDIVGGAMLAHKASAEGKTAVEVIAGKNILFEPQAIPAVVFTDPELAWTGLTEAEAKRKNIDIKVLKFPWGASGRAATLDRIDGLTKIIAEKSSGRIIGLGIVGAGAGELIAEGTLAIEMAAVADDIAFTIHAHPTLSETIMESAEMFAGQATHFFKPIRK